MKKLLLTAGLICLFTNINLKAQNYNPVKVSVPSMNISTDARSTGMGDIGVSSSTDAYSQYWNPSKYTRINSKYGFSIGYSPWLSDITSDVALMNVMGYYRISEESNQYLGFSLRYFKMGEVIDFGDMGKSIGDVYPHEYSVDLSYSRQLSENFSMGVGLRALMSDLGGSEKGYAFSADISGYYTRPVLLGDIESQINIGFNIKDIGTKMNYGGDIKNAFIPTKMNIGAGLILDLMREHKLSIHTEMNKLLVPTAPIWSSNESVEENNNRFESYIKMNPLLGIFKSFYDAPNGFTEELKEIQLNIGTEYSFNDKFFARAGYSYLSPEKGNLQGISFGLGFKMEQFRIDASYYVSTISNNPLNNNLKFSMSLDLDKILNGTW